jgi:hypothetical protein
VAVRNGLRNYLVATSFCVVGPRGIGNGIAARDAAAYGTLQAISMRRSYSLPSITS